MKLRVSRARGPRQARSEPTIIFSEILVAVYDLVLSIWAMPILGSTGRSVLLVFVVLGAGSLPLAKAVVRPDYFGAKQFSAQLQADFAKQHSQALIERIDREAMKTRVFSTFGKDAIESASAAIAWDQHIYPSLVRELGVLDTMTQFLPCRIELVDGMRVIESVVVNDKGEFRGLLLWLGMASDGTTKIVDIRFLGSSQEFSRRIRQVMILFGSKAAGVPDSEELALESLGQKNRKTISSAFEALRHNDPDEAFRRWSQADPELQSTRIWKDLRSTMAANGSALARQQIEQEHDTSSDNDSFTWYVLAMSHGDRKQALAALDGVLDQTRNLSFFRLLKGSLLLDEGRANEALELAEELYSLEPLLVGPHILAMRAALSMGKTDAAIRSLRHWNLVFSRTSIEGLLPNDALVTKFRGTQEYKEWKLTADSGVRSASEYSPASPTPR